MLMQDVRSAFRMLLKAPGFTATALLTLGLGIGANTAIFSVIDAVLVRPLPFPGADRLVTLVANNPGQRIGASACSDPDIREIREQSRAFDAIAAVGAWDTVLSGDGAPERLPAASVSPDFFPMLRVTPFLGRPFARSDETDGAAAILSRQLWERRFHANPAVVGRAITIDARRVTIVGVADAQIEAYLGHVDVWLPLALQGARSGRDNRFLLALGRLKDDISLEEARGDVEVVAKRLQTEYPATNAGWGIDVVPLHEAIVGRVRPTLLIFAAAVGLVLLVACANVASLLVARGAARRREIAVRLALGASRFRIARQLLVENAVLALAAGVAGVAVAGWTSSLLTAVGQAHLTPLARLSLDARVLAFAFFLAVTTGVLVGLGPAIHASRQNALGSLAGESRGRTSGAMRSRSRALLVVTELALTLVLLTGAGLLARSFLRVVAEDPGFDPRGAVTAQIFLPRARYDAPEKIRRFYDDLLARVATVPGIASAALAGNLPLDGGGSTTWSSLVPDELAPNPSNETLANTRPVSAEYFQTMGIPIRRGREFDGSDRADSPPVVIVSARLAAQLWPGRDPLGRHVRFWRGEETAREVVGVAADVKPARLDAPPDPEAYVPSRQQPWRMMVVVARSRSGGVPDDSVIRTAVQEIDRDLPIFGVRSLAATVDGALARRRFTLIVIASFACVALLLAVLGVYGVISYSVSQRTHELGIRVALGATQRDVVRMVVGQGLRLAIAGAGAGLAGAFLLTRYLSTLVFGVTPTDPLTFSGVSVLVIGLAMAASYVPARRAMGLDPVDALRSE